MLPFLAQCLYVVELLYRLRSETIDLILHIGQLKIKCPNVTVRTILQANPAYINLIWSTLQTFGY
jgi:hypothetical protein